MNEAYKLLKEAELIKPTKFGAIPRAKIILDKEKYDQALALLKEPCGTCGGSKRKPREKHCKLVRCIQQHEGITCHPDGKECEYYIPSEPCPDCQDKPAEQLPQFEDITGLYKDDKPEQKPQSEFKQKLSALFMECNADINHSGEIKKENNIKIWRLLDEACDRLEAAEDEIERQKKALDIATGYIGKNDCSAISIQNEIKEILNIKT